MNNIFAVIFFYTFAVALLEILTNIYLDIYVGFFRLNIYE